MNCWPSKGDIIIPNVSMTSDSGGQLEVREQIGCAAFVLVQVQVKKKKKKNVASIEKGSEAICLQLLVLQSQIISSSSLL